MLPEPAGNAKIVKSYVMMHGPWGGPDGVDD
jgi:hypothetical protein